MRRTTLITKGLKRKSVAVSAERRRFMQWIAASAMLGSHRIGNAVASNPGAGEATAGEPDRLKVAAIQMCGVAP